MCDKNFFLNQRKYTVFGVFFRGSVRLTSNTFMQSTLIVSGVWKRKSVNLLSQVETKQLKLVELITRGRIIAFISSVIKYDFT